MRKGRLSVPLSRGLMAGQRPLSRCAGGGQRFDQLYRVTTRMRRAVVARASIRWQVVTRSYSKPSWAASTACEASPTATSGPGSHRRFIFRPARGSKKRKREGQSHLSSVPRSRPDRQNPPDRRGVVTLYGRRVMGFRPISGTMTFRRPILESPHDVLCQMQRSHGERL